MGTNYYLQSQAPCMCCQRPFPKRHIGKSSYGWTFALHIYPDEGIHTFDDWLILLERHPHLIVDEYDRKVTLTDMLHIITERSFIGRGSVRDARFYKENHAIPGPNNLVRRKINNIYVVGHGEGTWDYLIGYFS